MAAAALLAALLLTPAAPARAEQPAPTPATLALDWNATAVAAVRAARVTEPAGTAPRPLYQTEGLLYMSYVQAAVYDAATSCSVQAAIWGGRLGPTAPPRSARPARPRRLTSMRIE